MYLFYVIQGKGKAAERNGKRSIIITQQRNGGGNVAWNWKEEVCKDYKSAKAALAKEQSERNFKKMIEVCHYIIEYHWHEAKYMEEFADLAQSYERTAVAFWKKYKTLESLYHVVYFYGDWTFTVWLYGLREPKRSLEHMKKGVLYAQLYHEKVNKDYSAVLFIRLYRNLYEILPEEGIDYLRKACSMAKEWARQFKTPFLLDEYLSVAFAASGAVREVRWKNKEEKQAAEREFGTCMADYKAAEEDVCSFPMESRKEAFPEEWKLFENLDRMRREALFDSEKLFAEHRKEIYHCIRTCMHLQRTAYDKGLKPLLLEGKKLKKSGRIYCGLLAYGIEIIGEAGHQHLTERMLERFGREMAEDVYAKYMAYLCTRVLEMIYKGEHTLTMQAFLLSCVPPGERGALLKYLEYQTV